MSAKPYLRPDQFYLDINSVSPGRKQETAHALDGAVRYVDVAVMAPVHPALHKTPMLLAGPHAGALLPLLQALDMKAAIAGDTVGAAAAIKMVRSVMVKGLEALTLECFLAAHRAGVEPQIFQSLSHSFPGLDWPQMVEYNLERMANHGTRRAHEMEEVADTLRELGIDPHMTLGTIKRQDEMGDWGKAAPLKDAVEKGRVAMLDAIGDASAPPTNRTEEFVMTTSDAKPRGDAAPKVSFVSLGCPKALVDSERIITRLRAEGYELSRQHDGADLVIVNTCGFLDSAQAESLDAIGTALAENGRVIVTGCMGAEPEKITEQYPNVLAITGPQQYESVLDAVHRASPRPHDPFLDLVPPEGIKLTPRHYAYLKISEGCNNRCSFCIIPKLRGDLVSRPAADVLREAERLVAAGVKELLVISQDTSAYGVDLKYATSMWKDREVRAKFFDLGAGARRIRRVGADALRLSLPACRRRHSADGGRQDPALSRHPVPACQSGRAQAHEAAGRAGQDAGAHSPLARDLRPTSQSARASSSDFPARPRTNSRCCSTGSTRRNSIASAASATSRWPAPPATRSTIRCRRTSSKRAGTASCSASRKFPRAASSARSAPASRSSSTKSGPSVAKGRSKGDAPEIDGAVYVASRRPLRVGEIATVKIERADDYDLHGTAVGF